MSEYQDILATLSPEKRALLELRLRKKGGQYNTFPASFAQQRLWFLDQFEPGNPAYNIPSAFRLRGRLNLPVMERSLNEIIQRHESLRTTFVWVNGQLLQVVSPHHQFKPSVIDLQDLPESDRSQAADQLIRQEARRPFQLSQGPLLRVLLIQLQPEEFILVFNMHHIISDGWSMGILLREFISLYQAFLAGQPSPLPPIRFQYGDFAKWQNQFMQGERLAEQLEYWKNKLGVNPEPLELPTDFPRPAQLSFDGATLPFRLERALVQQLHRLSRQHEATLFMTLLAGFQTLLYRYSGQDQISVGTPIANRTRKETEPLIGLFVNTLVLRTDLSGNPSFSELLLRVKETTLDAYAHQDVPLEKLVEALQPQRDMSHTPLFQVLLALQNMPVPKIDLPHLSLEPILFDRGVAQFDLSLNVAEVNSEITGAIEFNTRLFQQQTIQRMMTHFQQLLWAAASDPDQTIGRLPLLTEQEQQQITFIWNQTAQDYPSDQCLHQLFEAQVERTPEAIAVVDPTNQITYRELNSRANQLAHHLRQLGVTSEQVVALCIDRSVDAIIALLGILKAGAAYLPLDPLYPVERMTQILADANARLIVSVHRLSRHLPDRGQRIVHLDADWEKIGSLPSKAPGIWTHPDQLAYLIYTSGSTGVPKGVMVSHRAAINLWAGLKHAIYAHYPEQPYCVSLNAPLIFDASVQQWVMLLSGATVCIIPQDIRLDGEAMLAYMRDKKIEVLDCVPSQLKLLLDAGLLSGDGWTPSILLPGGEAIDPETWGTLRAAKATDTYNMYGPTECTVDSTICPMKTGPSRPAIGRPIINVTHYVLDQFMNPVPVGVPGELYIGGACLARGYYAQPQLTAEKFVPDPFSKKAGSRLYRTGDLVRYFADGHIEFLGRIDHQIKLRGFRIELGEIEAHLNHHEAISESAVVVREDQPGNKMLVAYLVASNEQHPSSADLRRYLRDRLPDYMVPSAFVYMDQLPRTASGKINRRALPSPEGSLLAETSPSRSARTPIEELLINIYAKILKIDHVSVDDNFFDLGGHSLLATQVMSRIREVFKVELPLRELFEAPVVADLARRIELAQHQAQSCLAPAIIPVARDEDLPLSFAQQRLWYLDQLDPNSPLYNIPMGLRLAGKLDIPALQVSLNAIVQRHENLRSSFPTIDGKPILRIAQQLEVPLVMVDLQELPESERERVALQLANDDARQPFQLSEPPLLRATIFRLGKKDHFMVLTLHHIISDGWSSAILMPELAALYQSSITGEPAALPELPIQYADFAHWQRNWLQGEVLEQQLAYWKEELADCPALLELPTDFPRPAVQTSNGAHFTFELPKELSVQLNRLSRQEGATQFMTMLAAFQILLYRYTGQGDFCVGTPIANRNRSETEALIGFFVNTLALRSRISSELSFRQLLARVRETTLSAYAHQDVPFEKVVDAVQPERNMSHSPIFQVMFTYQSTAASEISLPELTIRAVPLENNLAKFDLTLLLDEIETGIQGTFEYNTDLFASARIERMSQHFQRLLSEIVKNPDQKIVQLPLVTEAELQQLLHDWNRTDRAFPEDRCLHQLFEAQVARDPEAIAVTFKNDQLSYGQLNQRANHLAHYLQSLGVGVESRVGICLERSAETIVAILAVLKAGGGYVPIDPRYPAERLAFLIQDAQLAVLITQQHILPQLHTDVPIVLIDSDWDKIPAEAQSDPISPVMPENLAYIIYTSGSTGQPKGVQLQHRSVVNLAIVYQQLFQITPRDRIAQYFSFSFDGSVGDIFTALASGATLYIVDKDDIVGGEPLHRWFNEQKITLAILPPALLNTLPAQNLPHLKAIASGGESPSLETIARWTAEGKPYYNLYGPTEAAVVTTQFKITQMPAQAMNTIIGRPIPNYRVYVLDRQLQPVPIGVPGELCIAGVGLARGYFNRPEITALSFVPNPFGQLPGERLYRTGDLVRYRPDGNIEFLGRIDHQVKIRGFRIELGEIEAVLGQHSQLRETTVMVREDRPGEKRLVAYVVPATDPPPSSTELRSFLQARLPNYMIPSAFVMMKTLPLTQHGKIDYRSLPAPDLMPTEQDRYVAPSSDIEQILADIWCQVLKLPKVGIHDNFFELGGDSILSIQVISRANEAGLALTPRHIFQAPTVAALAQMATQIAQRHCVSEETGELTGELPLTPIQRWFFEQNLVDPNHWNQAVLVELRQNISPSVVRRSLAIILEHHDALRLRFEATDHGWRQYYGSATIDDAFIYVDLSSASFDQHRRLIEQSCAQAQASLDILSGKLIRGVYFDRGSEHRPLMLIVIHHLAIDGVSWRILFEDFQRLCQQILAQQRPALPNKTTSFRYWANRLVEWAQSDQLRSEASFWLKTIKGPFIRLPKDKPDGLNTEAIAQKIVVNLSEQDTQDLLQQVTKAYHTQIDEVLVTALARSLARQMGGHRVLIGLEGHGREDLFQDVDLSRTIGWFTTQYPVLIDLTDAKEIDIAIKQVKEQLRQIPNHGLGFGLLRYLLTDPELKQRFCQLPHPEIVFNYLGQFGDQSGLFVPSELPVGPMRSYTGQRPYLIDINGGISDRELRLEWTYSSDIFASSTVEQ
ncbi:MAG: amino acid adenylation domain-containing protein, partial [candidate division KSB1 bacterium]|nr:amino acid adenylation domain-containing protein [candidate division KSB1 bacterium]